MANRYWIGGSGNWNDTDNWSATSGGEGGVDVPTSSDNVYIDSSSGFGSGGTITLVGTLACNDFTSSSGHNFTLDTTEEGSLCSIYGSLTLESGITITGAGGFLMQATTSGNTITTAGVEIPSMEFWDGTGSWELQDNLSITNTFYISNGTFDANDHNITAGQFYFLGDTGYTPTVYMGSGTWEATGTDGSIWTIDEYNSEVVTIISETSTIKINDVIGDGADFIGGGKTYNNIWCIGSSVSGVNISGSNTFNDFKIDAPTTVRFDAGSTQTVSSFTATGTLGNLITITSSGEGQHFLSKTSGTVSCDYLDISNSNATGGATWYAGQNSINTNNNVGWIFGEVNNILILEYAGGEASGLVVTQI